MPKPVLLLPLLFIAQLATSQQQPLFKITVKGKTGYINSSGATVIPPVYHNAFDFKEGLAAVRENELYGFIDSSGKYVLTPQYDYATYFENGITIVYKNRQSYFIDKTGKVILPTVYRSIEFINPRKAVIATKSKRYGIIDIPTNRLLLDTLYSRIHFYNCGATVVRLFDPANEDYSSLPQGVIDTAGNLIVPFGKYEYIREFHNGFADVILDSVNNTPGVIDVTGRLVRKEQSGSIWELNNPYPEEKAFVNGLYSTVVNYRTTWINKQGNIVWQEPIDSNQTPITLNIDYMGHSQYRDYPEELIKLNDDSAYVELQGKRITPADHLPNNEFIFKFDTTQGFSANGYKTYKLIVGNSTNEAIKLMRISGLIILLEALDEDGAWKKIETIGFPTHTNGYDDIILNPGKFWPFIVAQYEGSFSTKLRAALWYLDKNEKVQTIYSNIIYTNINRTQFWREYDYPKGVNDEHHWNRSIDLSTIKRDDYGQFLLPIPNCK